MGVSGCRGGGVGVGMSGCRGGESRGVGVGVSGCRSVGVGVSGVGVWMLGCRGGGVGVGVSGCRGRGVGLRGGGGVVDSVCGGWGGGCARAEPRFTAPVLQTLESQVA